MIIMKSLTPGRHFIISPTMPIDLCPVCHAGMDDQQTKGVCPKCLYDKYYFTEPCEKCVMNGKTATVAMACGKRGGCSGREGGQV
jgi:hypothetical protein